MNHMLYGLYMANEHKGAEAVGMGFGTVQAMTGAMASAIGSHCTIM